MVKETKLYDSLGMFASAVPLHRHASVGSRQDRALRLAGTHSNIC